jgi:hypothetical protein
MPPLIGVDLFSGIGGFTHALRGLVDTKLFCDIDPYAISVLQARMSDNKLPNVPIWYDVQTLNRVNLRKENVKLPRKVDIVMGGFPCVGFSSVGDQDGFEEAQSHLFFNMLKVIDEFNPRFVFMENVPLILQMGLPDVTRQFMKRGYTLRWTIMTARQMGAPQTRKRWYCLAIRIGSKPPTIPEKRAAYKWNARSEPVTMVLLDDPAAYKAHSRCAVLGNAIVPAVARCAFEALSLWKPESPPYSSASSPLSPPIPWNKVSEYPSSGYMDAKGLIHSIDLTNLVPQKSKGPLPGVPIILDPKAYTPPPSKAYTGKKNMIPKPITLEVWATPRTSKTGAMERLTKRSLGDLPTQVRFARSTPDELRGGRINPLFVEWLMGFPKNWTRI